MDYILLYLECKTSLLLVLLFHPYNMYRESLVIVKKIYVEHSTELFVLRYWQNPKISVCIFLLCRPTASSKSIRVAILFKISPKKDLKNRTRFGQSQFSPKVVVMFIFEKLGCGLCLGTTSKLGFDIHTTPLYIQWAWQMEIGSRAGQSIRNKEYVFQPHFFQILPSLNRWLI